MPGGIVKRGDNVTLRTFERDDLDVLQRGAADPDIRHLTGNSKIRTKDDLEETFEQDSVNIMVVCLDDDGPPGPIEPEAVDRIGVVSVKEWARKPIVGIWIAPNHHGKGLGREAGELLIDYVFRSYDTPVIRANAFDHNTPSRRLLEALGFTEEGRLRMDAFIDGEFRDTLIYGLLREEWQYEDGPHPS